MIRFSGTPLDCSFVSFSPQQTLVERCFKLPIAASFPRPSSGRRRLIATRRNPATAGLRQGGQSRNVPEPLAGFFFQML